MNRQGNFDHDPAIQNLDDKSKLAEDLLKMLKDGTSNDVKIVLEDGEIRANKDILMARSDYFATMLSNENFVEGRDNCVDIRKWSVTKKVMEKVINYLFSGEMKMYDLSLIDLLKLMHAADIMLLKDIAEKVKTFTSTLFDWDYPMDCCFLPDYIKCLMYAEQHQLGYDIKESIIELLANNLDEVSHIPEVVIDSEAFKDLPQTLVKDILTEAYDEDISTVFDAFVFWLDGNECSEDDKRQILDKCIFFNLFTLDELLGKVKKTGLYTEERIDARIKVMFQEKDTMLTRKCEQVRQLHKKTRKLSDEKKKLIVELEDEKAKVMALSLVD